MRCQGRNPALVLAIMAPACGRLGFSAGDQRADGESGEPGAPPRCAPVDGDTVGLWPLDAASVAETTGQHPGTAVGSLGTDAGPCGTATSFGGSSYVRIADSPAFDLAEGSIEFFLSAVNALPATDHALLARDAGQLGRPGHLMVMLDNGGQIWVRLQHGADSLVCSDPLDLSDWIHVGISFGGGPTRGLQLWIDGQRAQAATARWGAGALACVVTSSDGIDGNDNTLVLGAANFLGQEGDPMPQVANVMRGGALDHVHLRSRWIDWGR